MADRFLPESEAARIIERAARLQEASAESSDGYSPGVSLEELRRIAAEVGIDPRYLEQALAEPTQPRITRSWLNLVEEREAVLDGELNEEGWEEVAEVLRSTGKFTTPISTGKSRTYTLSTGVLANCGLEVVSRKGRTRIKLRASAFQAYMAGLHVPLILALSLGIPMAASGELAPWIPIAYMAGTLGLGAGLFRTILGRTRDRAGQLFQHLTEAVGREAVHTGEAGDFVATETSPAEDLSMRLNQGR